MHDQKVILERDLADLYEVETKQQKRAVRRNIDRFTRDFMLELTKSELENWLSKRTSGKIWQKKPKKLMVDRNLSKELIGFNFQSYFFSLFPHSETHILRELSVSNDYREWVVNKK